MGIINAMDGARKLLLCFTVAMPVGVTLLVLHYISGAEWIQVANTCLTVYGAGNVGERFINYLQSKTET